ncbi:MAG: VOC family protein [Rhizobiaceae bacterium]|nr:VOC family protein [Rhizobiaceae bacterium]
MAICSLGYLGVYSDKFEEWSDLAQGLLGMQQMDRGHGNLSFRMDDHKQRFVVSGEESDGLAFMGWEVEEKADLLHYAARLEAAGHYVTAASAELADKRFVEEMIYVDDPAGNRIELYFNPMLDTDPFIPGRTHSGFCTGPYGLGHAVLHVEIVQSLVPFYRDLLDFQVSDFALKPVELCFFHINGRHHSFAMIGSGKAGFHHFMIEFNSLDDVGQGYDLALSKEGAVAQTLGRHTNDWMTSFYAHTPSGFFIENGWGGRIIDPETWQPHETNTGPSFWGHERLYLGKEEREPYSRMSKKLAEDGKQTPPLIDCPWLYGQFNHPDNR